MPPQLLGCGHAGRLVGNVGRAELMPELLLIGGDNRLDHEARVEALLCLPNIPPRL